MPADHGLRPHDFQSVQRARCQPIQPGKYQTIDAAEGKSLRRFTSQHVELMTKRQDLCLQRRSRPEQSDQRQANQPANISHQPRASPDSTSLASRIEFPTMTAPHNGSATLIWRISWRISTVTAGRPQRCFDFHRQYDLNPPRCQRITVSGRTIARAPYILGNSRQTPPNINLSIETNRSLLGLARRSTFICCLSTRISASSAQHRAILSQLPARLNLRQ